MRDRSARVKLIGADTNIGSEFVSPLHLVGRSDTWKAMAIEYEATPVLSYVLRYSLFEAFMMRAVVGLSGILCSGRLCRHASEKGSLNMTANWVFASNHSRGGRFQSSAA